MRRLSRYYEQTILDRGCKQAICIPCYEKIIKNECPVCRDEIDLAKLAPKSAKAVTKAIATCNLLRELDEDETQAAAKKHMEFYQNQYQLRDPATFDSQYDFSDDPLISNTLPTPKAIYRTVIVTTQILKQVTRKAAYQSRTNCQRLMLFYQTQKAIHKRKRQIHPTLHQR